VGADPCARYTAPGGRGAHHPTGPGPRPAADGLPRRRPTPLDAAFRLVLVACGTAGGKEARKPTIIVLPHRQVSPVLRRGFASRRGSRGARPAARPRETPHGAPTVMDDTIPCMATLFSRIIAGDLPGHFVWQDPEITAFLTIAPLRPGHTLVVPRREVDRWTDADGALLARCFEVAQAVGQGVQLAWNAPRAGLLVAGFEVPHLHIHVAPVWDMSDFDFSKVKPEEDQAALQAAAEKLRAALLELGHEQARDAGPVL
jgi:diadenosine tetraphosphate (Ap4A) HIT family hydrolase